MVSSMSTITPSVLILAFALISSWSLASNNGAMAFMSVSRGGRHQQRNGMYAQPPSTPNDNSSSTEKISTSRSNSNSNSKSNSNSNSNSKQQAEIGRRSMFQTASKAIVSNAIVSSAVLSSSPSASYAMNNKSRSDGYEVQYTEREWSYLLSGKQYNILREGGTERPNSSILEAEERNGQYKCAACSTPLFTSSSKFHSGTGWPSYASALPGVEVEAVNAIQANLLGAEIRCGTCGGHLGDLFNDGFIYVNTPAFVTGKRYCVDGAALIFTPEQGAGTGAGEEVFGDLAPPKKENGGLPDFLSPPKIVPKEI